MQNFKNHTFTRSMFFPTKQLNCHATIRKKPKWLQTFKSKHTYEQEALSGGVKINCYKADNGIYRSKEFLQDLKKFGQTISFSGLSAHHHNRVAERNICTVTNCARTILIHTITLWSEHSLEIWPMTLDYVVYVSN